MEYYALGTHAKLKSREYEITGCDPIEDEDGIPAKLGQIVQIYWVDESDPVLTYEVESLEFGWREWVEASMIEPLPKEIREIIF